ncbi:MAG: DNA polymerase III subunit alpha [Patescibacteria group bacterium]|nr:DNA polymerase III subunit alpha [Patescibacteria group bacterium]
MPKFVHLHTHSHYSLLDGLAKIEDLVARTKELGMDTLALTDHGVLYGAVEFYKKTRAAGIKPILGVEAYIAPKERQNKDAGDRYYHLILLAENNTGWKNLIKLVTKAQLEGFYYKPRMDKELLREYHEGIISLSGCFSGELARAILAGDSGEKILKEYQDIFGPENFFIEIGYHPHINRAEHDKLWNGLIALSKKTGAPLVATQDLHYARPEDRDYHDILLAVQTGSNLSDQDRLTLKADDFSMTSPEDMAEKFKDIPEAVTNTVRIAERCNVTLELGKTQLPEFPKPEGISANEYVRTLATEGLTRRFPGITCTQEAKDRLEYELGVIEKTGFADYFLIVQDLTGWARAHGIAVGPGRGSAAGSLVSYVLGITDINPLKYGLLFERFLNPERIQMPDIDIDFADARRDEVLAYARQKYGEDHVAQIITFGTMAARAAVRDAGRAMGLPYGFCDQIAKLIPFNASIKESIDQVPELADMAKQNEEARRLLDAAQHLEGVARHASVHACGTVITKKPLTEYLPLQYAPQDRAVIITQFEMHSVEDLGLLKMDLLGLRNLTIIEETVRLVKNIRGEDIYISDLPLDDAATYSLLQAGNTTGVFQFECLSEETIVSNTTIKKLYERKNKKTLESVYVDEGKVHKNKILGVAKSGVKDVYALVAENGWYIKSSADHNFLTENGWKKLSDIRPGEKILMKTKAKHLVYNACARCGRQISGQKEGHSTFCYTCSARVYSNPSKPISRTKMKVARTRFFERGGTVWNEGVTTENNETWRATAEKISHALTGVSIETRWGKKKAAEIKARLSQRFRGAGNPMFGKPAPHRKGGVRGDLGHYVRSNWEADFARILKLYGIAYEYEPRSFTLQNSRGEVMHYTPDFYVKATNTFYEIKGWLHDIDQKKMDLFRQQYPEYNFILINKTKFAELAMRYRSLVAWECPRVPTERSFKFIKVREVRYAGKEETYDIAMEAPGNNFVANGFVVHNSSGMRRYMKDIHPTELEDLIALVALFRPGPMELIPTFIKRKRGEEKIVYLHPRLEPILKNTNGIGVYQEQMMQIARDLAGYTLPEADTLRKAIGKKIKSLLDEQKVKLTNGMIKNGIPQKTAEAIWELFPPFARYGFNKSHAACYALIGYQTAYLKAHYPVESMAALLNAEVSDIERIAFLVNEARQTGISILPPDVNSSLVKFSPNGEEVRYGLLGIKNVGEQIAQAIVEERIRGGAFENFTSFLARIQHKDLNKKSLESLAKCGALESLDIERNQAIQNMDDIVRFAGVARKTASQTNSLFGNSTASLSIKLKPAPPATREEKLGWEKELLGFYLSDHPLNSFKEQLATLRARTLTELRTIKNESLTIRAAGLITTIKKIFTKKGDAMMFVTIEDFSPQPFEIVIFPRVLEKTQAVWQENNVVLLQGKMSWRGGEPKIICDDARKLELHHTEKKTPA